MAFHDILAPGFDPDIFGLPFARARLIFDSGEVSSFGKRGQGVGEPDAPAKADIVGVRFVRRLKAGTLIATGCTDPVARRWREIPTHVWNEGLVNFLDATRGTLVVGSQMYERVRIRDIVGLPLNDALHAYQDLGNHFTPVGKASNEPESWETAHRGAGLDSKVNVDQAKIANLCGNLFAGTLRGSGVKRIPGHYPEIQIRRHIYPEVWERAEIDVETWSVRFDGIELHDVRVKQVDPEEFIKSIVTRGLARSIRPARFGTSETRQLSALEKQLQQTAREISQPATGDGGLHGADTSDAPVKTPLGADASSVECPVTRDQFISASDPLEPLVQWARWTYRTDKVPSREQLLADHRTKYGQLPQLANRLYVG